IMDRAESLLKSLGATDVKVDCMGDGGWDEPSFDPMVTAEYSSAHLPKAGLLGENVKATWQTLALRDFNGCDLTRQLLVGLTSGLEVRNVKAAECDQADASYRFQLDSL